MRETGGPTCGPALASSPVGIARQRWSTMRGAEQFPHFPHRSTDLAEICSILLAASSRHEETTPECPVAGHSCEVFSVDFSSNGNRVVSGSGDTFLKIWETETGTEVMTGLKHTLWRITQNSMRARQLCREFVGIKPSSAASQPGDGLIKKASLSPHSLSRASGIF